MAVKEKTINYTTEPSLSSEDVFHETTEIAESSFGTVQLYAELYVILPFIVLAILMNAVALKFWVENKKVVRSLSCMVCTLILSEEIYLACFIPYLVLRPRGEDARIFNGSFNSSNDNYTLFLDRRSNAVDNLTSPEVWKDLIAKYGIVNYITIANGIFQCFSAWMLYLCASEANSLVREVVLQEAQSSVPSTFPGVLFSIIAFYYIGFVPEFKREMIAFVKFIFPNVTITHNLNLNAFQNHWDFVLNEADNKDFIYIVYLSLSYIVITYVAPYVMIVIKDKNVIDSLHSAQILKKSATYTPASFKKSSRRKMSEEKKATKKKKKEPYRHQEERRKVMKVAAESILIRESRLYPSLVVSVTCNVFLVCVALKMVILMFKLFEHSQSVVAESWVFFGYLNVYSNLIQICKSAIHLPAVVLYNYNNRTDAIRFLRRHLVWFGKKKKKKRESDSWV